MNDAFLRIHACSVSSFSSKANSEQTQIKFRHCFYLDSRVKSEEDDDDDDDDDGNYLHPSLFASKKCSRLEELMKVLETIKITFLSCKTPDSWTEKF